MTYNEWRDELKNNLLSVSDGERRKVLDYYAEAYADRREAGFTERQIIQDFGAPYDAAQRILYENDDETYAEAPKYTHFDDSRDTRSRCESRCDARREARRDERRDERRANQNRDEYYEPQPQSNVKTAKMREDYTWVFVLLCVVFAVPLFCLVMTMVGVTISLCVAPFGVLIAGVGRVCVGIGTIFSNAVLGAKYIGIGLIQTGVGLVLIPLFIWLVKLMWKLFRMFFRWVRRLFSGKEGA